MEDTKKKPFISFFCLGYFFSFGACVFGLHLGSSTELGFGCERGAPIASCDIGKEAQRGKCVECGLGRRALGSASVRSLSDRDVLAFSFITAVVSI